MAQPAAFPHGITDEGARKAENRIREVLKKKKIKEETKRSK